MNFKSLSEDYKSDYITKVCRLLEIPSVYNPSETYPYGSAINQALNEMLTIASDDGFDIKNIDRHAGHIEFGEGDELFGILGHLDVVPAGKGWEFPPFQPTIKDGKLYARGAQDDKGPVMAAYIAMKLLKDQGFKPKKRIRLILGTDEERDWEGIEYYFAKEEMPKFGFTPDASFPVIHAEKGLVDVFMNFSITCENELNHAIDIVEFSGGDRLNMVPDEASVKLDTKLDIEDEYYKYLQKKGLDGEVTVQEDYTVLLLRGRSVHASKPETGTNAITKLLEFLITLPVSDEAKNIVQQLKDGFFCSNGKGIDLQCQDEQSGPLTLNLGSLQINSSGEVKAGVNIRYPVTTEYGQIINQLKRFTKQNNGTLEVYDHLKSLYIEKDDPFIETLLRVYNEATGSQETAKSMGGATYARSLESGVAYGALFNHSQDTAHQKDEHVLIADMVKAIEIYASALYEWTK